MNIIIWIQALNQNGGGVELLQPAVNILARLYGNINLQGLISPLGIDFDKIKILNKEDLKNIEFDLILVTGGDISFAPLLKEAKSLDIDEDKIILDRVICTPLFTLEKYKKLRHSQLSILSMNCFGGLVYHRFGLPFLSPTINMFTSDENFLKFLKNPIQAVKAELKFIRSERNEGLKIDYPVYKIGETEWKMNHYGDANFAYRKWIERSFRINWLNTLAVMYTEEPEILAEFDKLPFAKKVCFVPFETDLDSGFYINPKQYPKEPFWRIVNLTAMGAIINYDFWDMLLYGKKTPLNFQK